MTRGAVASLVPFRRPVAERDAAWRVIHKMRHAFDEFTTAVEQEIGVLDFMEVQTKDVESDGIAEILPDLKALAEAMEPDYGRFKMVDQLQMDTMVAFWRADHPGDRGMPVEFLGASIEGLAARQEFAESKVAKKDGP